MNTFNAVKATIIVAVGAVLSVMGNLAIPFFLLVLFNIIDYGTGVVESKYRNSAIDSRIGFRGIAKKICMWLLVALGVIIDNVIVYATNYVGITLPLTFAVACVVAIWLIVNELLSILENINDIGTPLPPFMKPLLENIKTQVENKVEVAENATESEQKNE